jgi:hypothetical protein
MDDFDLVETVIDSHIKDNNTCSDRLVNHVSDNITINTTSKTKRNMPDSVKVDTSKHMSKLPVNNYQRFALLEIDMTKTIDDMQVTLSLGYDTPILIAIRRRGDMIGQIAIDGRVGLTERTRRAVALVCVSDRYLMAMISYNKFLDPCFRLVGLKETESGYVQVMTKSIQSHIGLDLSTLSPICGFGHRFMIGYKPYYLERKKYDRISGKYVDAEEPELKFVQEFDIYDCKSGTIKYGYFYKRGDDKIECAGFSKNFVVLRFVFREVTYFQWIMGVRYEMDVHEFSKRLLFVNLINGQQKSIKHNSISKSRNIHAYEMPCSTVMILGEDIDRKSWIITVDNHLQKINIKQFSAFPAMATLGIRPCLIGTISKSLIFVLNASCDPKSYIPKSMTIAVTNGKEIEIRELSLSKRSYREKPGVKKPVGFCFSEVERSVKCWLRSRYRSGGMMVEIRMLIGKGLYQLSA